MTRAMELDLPDPALVASARQIMDVPEEDPMQDEDGPLYVFWFALGHVAVLLYLAVHALKLLPPMERDLLAGTALLAGLTLVLLFRARAPGRALRRARSRSRNSR